jgi:hypothetical protein
MSITVRDHRGSAWRLARTPWKEAKTRELRRDNFPDARDMVVYLAIAVISAVVIWGAFAIVWRLVYGELQANLKNFGLPLTALISFAIPIAFAAPHAFLVYKAARWLWAPIEAREMLRKNLCPHCRFSLAAIFPDLDGCTVCPECGAAWKLPPPTPNNPA